MDWPAEKPRRAGEPVKGSQWSRNTMKAQFSKTVVRSDGESKSISNIHTYRATVLLILYCY